MNKEEFQKALKPITDGLFGKQGTKRYERPHFPLRPLDRMLGDLAAIEPVEWFRYVFSREPLNGKFTDPAAPQLDGAGSGLRAGICQEGDGGVQKLRS